MDLSSYFTASIHDSYSPSFSASPVSTSRGSIVNKSQEKWSFTCGSSDTLTYPRERFAESARATFDARFSTTNFCHVVTVDSLGRVTHFKNWRFFKYPQKLIVKTRIIIFYYASVVIFTNKILPFKNVTT